MIDSLLLEIVHPFELQTGQIFIDITINIKTITNTWCPSSLPATAAPDGDNPSVQAADWSDLRGHFCLTAWCNTLL